MFLELIVLLRLFSLGSSKKECGISHFKHRDVAGRVIAAPHSWPWMASLLYQNDSGQLPICGAVVVAKDWAITAAHCVQNIEKEKLRLRVGSHNLNKLNAEGPLRQVAEVFTPEYKNRFDTQTKNNDIALLKLNYELCLGKFIQPICLPNYDDDFRDDGSLGYVAGWGQNSNVLRQAQVHVISNGACKTFFTVEILCITFACIPEENQVCTHPTATYDGESGGPLMMRRTYQRGNETIRRWFFFGVISFQKPAAGPGSSQISLNSLNEDVYTRVVPHCKWIEEKTKDAVNCTFGD